MKGVNHHRALNMLLTLLLAYADLLPIELERLNGFPDNHTLLKGVSNTKRAFFMGNALVVGVVEKIGQSLIEKIKEYA